MSNKILAFKVAYLLGVEENVLKRDYEEDYEVSESLARFTEYEDAKKLRSLSRARLSVMRYNHLYVNNRDLRSITGPYLENELVFLETQGINLVNIFSELSEIDYFNKITEYIKGISYNVLKGAGIPRPEIINEFFNFPIFDTKDFKQFLKVLKTLSCPHGMIFYNGAKIKQSLSYSLLNNKNLYFSAYSMLCKRYDGRLDFEKGYEWDTKVIEPKVVEIPNKLIQVLQDRSSAIAPSVKKVTNNVTNKLYTNSIPLLDRSMLKFIDKNETEVFVDCDNSDFFKVVNFLRVLEGYKTIKGIKLIVDLKSNFLWKVFKELYTGTIPVTIVQVQRIKENKSVADIVLTKELCESYYTRNLRQAIIVSSDSDFFGLITSLSDISFCIAYTDGQMNDEYLGYLENNGVTVYDLINLDSKEVLEHYKDICIEYLLAYTLVQTPATRWELSNISSIVNYHITKETDLELDDTYISEKVTELMNDVKLTLKGFATLITIRNISIDSSAI